MQLVHCMSGLDMQQGPMPTGSHNGQSNQIAVRLPLEVDAELTRRAPEHGSRGKAIVAALRKAWNLPEPADYDQARVRE